MTLWMIRSGRLGETEQTALDEGLAIVDFREVPDLSGVGDRDSIEAMVREGYPDANDGKVRNFTGQLYAFARRIKEGDLVAMPLKTRPQVALGRIAGAYRYRPQAPAGHHTRPVQWLRPDIPRTQFGQDLLYSLGAFMTVCQIRRNDAESRIRTVLEGGADPGLQTRRQGAGSTSPTPEVSEDESTSVPDVEQLATDQILSQLEVQFKGHELARLVEAILRAQGYVTTLSAAGPDGGVDVLAGQGPLGLDGPKICVQVKSSQSSCGVNVLRELQGSMTTFKANQGLLVSWGGFTSDTQREARQHHFSVRLWDAASLLEALVENYEHLPAGIRSELPLKKIWALVLEE